MSVLYNGHARRRTQTSPLHSAIGGSTILLLSVIGCGNSVPSQPANSGIARIEIQEDSFGVISVPFRGTTTVTVLARDAAGRVVMNAPSATLVSRDTTIIRVEPGLVLRSTGQGTTTVIATMNVDGRTLLDSARAGVVVPLGGLVR
jgi:hypothetical protein